MTPLDTKLEFIETADTIWDHLDIDGQGVNSFHDLYQRCLLEMENMRRPGRGTLLHVNIE